MPSPIISIGQLIDETWNLYRTRFNELMSVSSWLLLLAIFYALSLSLYPSASTLWFSNELTWSEFIGVILFTFTNYLLAPLLGVWVFIALARLARMQLFGRTSDVKKAISEVRTRFFPTIIISVMIALLLVVATFIGIGPSIVLATLGSLFKIPSLIILGNIILGIGIFVAFALAFKWMVEYMLAPYSTVIDGLTGKKGLIATRKIVYGRFWSVLIRLAVPKFVYIFIGILLMSVVAYTVGILMSAVSGLNMDLQLRLNTLIEWTIPIVIAVLINPLLIISDLLLYKSLKGD